MFTFRCRNCGRLHKEIRPHACEVCGKGVSFSPEGIKTITPDNWEAVSDIVWSMGSANVEPQNISLYAEEGIKSEDKG